MSNQMRYYRKQYGFSLGDVCNLTLPKFEIDFGPVRSTIVAKNPLNNIYMNGRYFSLRIGNMYADPKYGGRHGSIVDLWLEINPWRRILRLFKRKII